MKQDGRRGKYKLSYICPITKKRRLTRKTWKTKSAALKDASHDNKIDPSPKRKVVKYI